MNLQEIKDKLVLKFSAPLDEYYKRHVVFWTDTEKEFEDIVDQLELENVRIFKLSLNNYFEAKMILNEDSDENLLIYDSTGITEKDKRLDWLCDSRIIYQKESMTLDYYSMIMDKIGVVNESIKPTIRSYEKFWKNEERIEKLKKIAPSIKTSNELHLAILATLVGADSVGVSDILYHVFTNGLDVNENKCIKAIESFGSPDVLWKVVDKFCGDCHKNLKNAIDTILVSALTQTMGSAVPNKIRSLKYDNGIPDCYALVNEWTHNPDYKDNVLDLLRNADKKMELFELFDSMSLDELIASDVFPSINVALLRKVFSAVANKALNHNKIKSIVTDREKMLWYDDYSNYFNCLNAIADLLEIYEKNASGFHYAIEEELWKDYQNELYKFDAAYRHIHYYFYQTSFNAIDEIQDKLKDVIQYVENLYKNGYLDNVNSSWINLIKSNIDSTGKINEKVKTQLDFFSNFVEQKCEDKLTFVIISDGMRYDVAKELANDLQYQLKCNINIEAIQAVFPAITKYGMAALLPGKKSLDESLNVLSNGLSTRGVQARRTIIQNAISDSDAIDYVDLFNKTTTEKKEYLKGKKVIYVYHNDIDKSGHDSAGESKVFDSCKESIDKIVNLVKSLVNARSSIRVVITSDHGFIYTAQKLDELDKMSFKSDDIIDAEGEKRCIVTKNPVSSEYLVPVKLLINNNDYGYYGYAPLQTIRLKANGGTANYVHGGLSLQELMVPVVVFDNVRTSSKAYESNKEKYDHNAVEIDLVTNVDSFHGSLAKLEFYQTKPLGLDAVESKYDVVFVDENGNEVSDTQQIIANKTDSDPANRGFKVILTIKSSITTGTYYLNVINHDSNEMLIKKEFKLVNDLGSGMFDF